MNTRTENGKKTFEITDGPSRDALFDACHRYFEKTGRRVTFEYSLIARNNDSVEDAAELGALLAGMNCHERIGKSQIGEFIVPVARHLVQHRAFAVYHFVV